MSWYLVLLLYLCYLNFLFSLQIGGLLGYFYGFPKVCICRCGISWGYSKSWRTGRLQSGETASPHEFPWLAAINTGSQVIAGSLISDRHVVTSASPLYGLAYDKMTVTLGAHDRCSVGGSAMNVSVSSVRTHPRFSIINMENDIALVRLTHLVAFSEYISPICMPIFGVRKYEQVVWTAGWSQNNTVCIPRVTILPTLSEISCLKSVADSKLVTADKGCLGTVASKSVICKGDTGAPVMTRWSPVSPFRLLGVMSSASCDVSTPPLYTRLIDHAAWIHEHIRDDCQCF